MKVAIVEDEQNYLRKIKSLVDRFCVSRHIPTNVQSFEAGKPFLFYLSGEVYFDVFLFDIELPDSNGMSLAEMVRKKYPEAYIIFITSHTQYSLDAFELNVFRYIRKDKIETKLQIALEDLWKELTLGENNFYLIDTCMRQEKIFNKKIIYIYKEGKNSVFITSRGSSKVRKALSKVFDELGCSEFILVDRSFIVNAIHIMKVIKNELILRNGEVIVVSRLHIQEVKSQISAFWGRNI